MMILMAATVSAAPAMAAPSPDAAKGKMLFLQCTACHSVAKGAPNKVGPNLNGLFGAKAGSRAGFAFSPALAKAGFAWDEKRLDAFIAKPQAVVPGNRMAFGGVANADSRRAIIAYLRDAAK
ncbi:c-type cytochrome [Sphingobium sp. CR2-8]|uniref:c-type cytochrome n=1 Tax=Sphingobium sp. CR2-8 TaxID=1306534 RepID=UPI002DBA1BCF|nr:c-type cytochrome [Sphingobium sp. CR2-8]MEC3911422.1 c-type cytochrome [Sphingobium sp. CR2-8]